MKINSKTTFALAGLLIFSLASPALAKGYQSRANSQNNAICTEEQRAANQAQRDERRAKNRANCENDGVCTLTEEERAQKQAQNRADRPGQGSRGRGQFKAN
ncbi:Hypothetical protein ING2D1G_1432 [Peptoniphilus sp. ING2-D1G]|nr:Hypothetical protein ING2D1G_1432 [Peptoniphilus sp. ING2-D1G]